MIKHKKRPHNSLKDLVIAAIDSMKFDSTITSARLKRVTGTPCTVHILDELANMGLLNRNGWVGKAKAFKKNEYWGRQLGQETYVHKPLQSASKEYTGRILVNPEQSKSTLDDGANVPKEALIKGLEKAINKIMRLMGEGYISDVNVHLNFVITGKESKNAKGIK